MQRDPRNIKTGWKENLATFLTELKTLEASDMTTMGLALNAVFETLNINQKQSGIGLLLLLPVACRDRGGDGRGKLPAANTVQRELTLPMTAGWRGQWEDVGGEGGQDDQLVLYFRWDQRLYVLMLRMGVHFPMSRGSTSLGMWRPTRAQSMPCAR